MVDGLSAGLNQKHIKLTNLALGGTSSLQNLYELYRVKNQNIIQDADFIITESNINDIHHNRPMESLPLDNIYRNLKLYFSKLSILKKKIIILILPETSIKKIHNGFECSFANVFFNLGYDSSILHTMYKNQKIINNFYRELSYEYGFNVIDMQDYYERYNLCDFGARIDSGHPQNVFMRKLGENIIDNLDSFKLSYEYENDEYSDFVICTPRDMQTTEDILVCQNSKYQEITYRLKKDQVWYFPEKYLGYQILGIHAWTKNDNKFQNKNWSEIVLDISNITLKNSNCTISKQTNSINAFLDVHRCFIIDGNSVVVSDMSEKCTEYYCNAHSWNIKHTKLPYSDIIAFFLAKNINHDLYKKSNFEKYIDKVVKIPKERDFSSLIPPIKFCQEAIDEYCAIIDPRKLAPLQHQIKLLKQESTDNQKYEFYFKYKTAKIRIQEHLAYRLGRAMIENSKSIWGYIRMPFVLSYIKDKHKLEQKAYKEKIKENPNLALPPLETYPDYDEALREKECFTYK
ncbi:SGNH/GDSL hydrolase family protein, partial [Campylobacter jejuni]